MFSGAQARHVNMKAMIALLFLVAVAVYARAEMEYHPQAILHYLEMEEREMARKIHSYLELRKRPTRFPSPRPTMVPPTNDAAVSTIFHRFTQFSGTYVHKI